MKKIFTLVAMAAMAIGVNAQTGPTESYEAVGNEASNPTVKADFLNATIDADKNMVVNVKTTHVTMKAVDSSKPEDLLKDEGYKETDTYDNTNWPVWKDAKWALSNKKKRIWVRGEDGESVVDKFYFNVVMGVGVAASGWTSKPVYSDDVFSKLQADYTGKYFDPKNVATLPTRGEFIEFTADVDGMFKIGFLATSGTNRALYIVDATDGKVLNPESEYKVEGYVNGADGETGAPLWQASIKVNIGVDGIEDYTIGDTKGKRFKDGSWQDNDETRADKYGWFVFDAKKDHKYVIFGSTWQFGFRGYEFTPGATQQDYTPQDPTGIEAVKTVAAAKKADAAIYNLAGQKVNAAFKGMVIQNGRKFINK